jgi:hypothetical protein
MISSTLYASRAVEGHHAYFLVISSISWIYTSIETYDLN